MEAAGTAPAPFAHGLLGVVVAESFDCFALAASMSDLTAALLASQIITDVLSYGHYAFSYVLDQATLSPYFGGGVRPSPE